ncbi:MAG: hypothetical protein LUE86_00500 [Clostridiales bacterium]|nr:hypothetical protein [Clostridiales bacterium]
MMRYTKRDEASGDYQSDYIWEALIRRLGEYEDLEEQGLLLRLPCKAGDPYYSIVKHSHCHMPDEMVDDCAGCEVTRTGDKSLCDLGWTYTIEERKCLDMSSVLWLTQRKDFGKSVFLARDDAERRILELERSGGRSLTTRQAWWLGSKT